MAVSDDGSLKMEEKEPLTLVSVKLTEFLPERS